MSEDNLVLRVLQQDSELVKRKLKACEIYRDCSQDPYSITLNEDLPVKFIFNFKDGQTAVFNDFRGMQDFLDKMENVHQLEEENKNLKEKLDIAVKALEFYANESHFGDTTYGINGENECWHEGNVEDGTKAQEALAKIKEIK